jgi:hypothetical protein
MSRLDDLRAQREARFIAKAKRPLGALEPKPVTEIATKPVTNNPVVTENPPIVTENTNALVKRGRGRPSKSAALSPAERNVEIEFANPNPKELNRCPPI